MLTWNVITWVIYDRWDSFPSPMNPLIQPHSASVFFFSFFFFLPYTDMMERKNTRYHINFSSQFIMGPSIEQCCVRNLCGTHAVRLWLHVSTLCCMYLGEGGWHSGSSYCDSWFTLMFVTSNIIQQIELFATTLCSTQMPLNTYPHQQPAHRYFDFDFAKLSLHHTKEGEIYWLIYLAKSGRERK